MLILYVVCLLFYAIGGVNFNFAAAKILLFYEICKFLGEKYAGIGRFRVSREIDRSSYRVIERGKGGLENQDNPDSYAHPEKAGNHIALKLPRKKPYGRENRGNSREG